ncbi:MAG: alpha/beta hydrolase [Hydrocarboniphaga sp.]|uniref:alpha/beta hydrolase n=1 Tax=Hydrocarboniphaga sp. TaxID=2033016 RepID=UPI00260C4227|nr:alpha/beta fold hydrolase [Hydrocarboniphaga sp.]MDB5969922.1 alpha/beta hydrolase [Hydrocarboniphaga sp.]
MELAAAGFHALSLDLRGHGDSSWAADGDYRMDRQADDLRAVLAQLPGRPGLVGASLGGLAALLTVGEGDMPCASALVLVDIVPNIEMGGATEIHDFMRSAPDGFASLDEAADADHMVAGDRNDAFNRPLIEFLRRVTRADKRAAT